MDLSTTTASVINLLGESVTVGTKTFKAIIDINVEFYDDEGVVTGYGDVVSVRTDDLPEHVHGTEMTASSTGRVYRLQRTIKDDGAVRTIQVTR